QYFYDERQTVNEGKHQRCLHPLTCTGRNSFSLTARRRLYLLPASRISSARRVERQPCPRNATRTGQPARSAANYFQVRGTGCAVTVRVEGVERRFHLS